MSHNTNALTEVHQEALPSKHCPNCGSGDSLHSSRRRNLAESLLSLFIPVIRPYRCHACNWRGFIGVLPIVKNSHFNRALNGLIFLSCVFLVVYQAISYFGIRIMP